MATHLETIVARTRLDVHKRMSSASTKQLESRAQAHSPRGFAAALRRQADRQGAPAIIAELKKASPSKGVIRAEFDAAVLARTLEAAGAAALSVLTDEPFFQGSLTNLELASGATTIPCLRKDFMVDPFQMLEARASGADAVLLIVAALSDAELRMLAGSAGDHGLDVLCEVHDAAEMDRAVGLGCQMIGVNSRDLRSFVVRPEVQMELAGSIPQGVVRVAESGVRTRAEMDRLAASGYNAFLVGEALMSQSNPAAALMALLKPVTQQVTVDK